MNNKEIALAYLRQGLSVIPVTSPKMISPDTPEKEMIEKCKRPLISWKEYQTRLPTEVEVCQWFEQNPDANIGIVTGKISNLVVFDLDSTDAIEYAESEGGFPDTPKVKTGKGHHVYMRHPGFEIRNSVNKKLDIDIRADGGFAVAPPSIHGSGRQYDWEPGFSIHDIKPAACELWMIDYLQSISNPDKQKTTPKSAVKTPQVDSGTRNNDSETLYAELLKNGCMEGMRNQSATSLTGHLFAKGLAAEEVWQILKIWNTNNQPPIDRSELRKTFESVQRLETQNKIECNDDKDKDHDISDFLDTPEKVTAEYDEQYVRVSFALNMLSNMEAKLNGGFVGGRLYVLGGIPSSGKTVLVNNIADNISIFDYPVLFFSYDDGRIELRYRTFSRFSGSDIEQFNQRQLDPCDLDVICKNRPLSRINTNKYVVQEMIKVDEWHHIIDKIKNRHGKAPVIIADYLRKLKMKNGSGEERLRVDGLLSMLTDLAKRYNTPVIVISELARDSYKSGQRLSMASFKESGSIEYEASWLGILAAVEETGDGYNLKHDWERIINHDGNIDLIVFKAKRGMNIAVRPAYRSKTTDFPVEWTDKWGNSCYLNHGYWEAKNYRVMDALGYMLLLKEGGNSLKSASCPIFNDLGDVMLRENQLDPANCQGKASARYSIGFTDRDFRKMTGLKLGSSEILNLLLETQRSEFKLTFPVRLKSTGAKQQVDRMNIYSRFFELAAEEIKVRKDGVVQERRYRVLFNTILGELFVNNLKARFNDRIDHRLYALLPDSAQILYRRLLLHHNGPRTEVYFSRIAELTGLNDSNETNLRKTIEQNILRPLQEHGYINSYEETEGLNGTKYVIWRSSKTKSKDGGSVKPG